MCGVLETLDVVDNCIKIKVTNHVPFKLNMLSFNIWDKTLKRIARRLIGHSAIYSFYLQFLIQLNYCVIHYNVKNSLLIFLLFVVKMLLEFNFLSGRDLLPGEWEIKKRQQDSVSRDVQLPSTR